ncbi:hypothetical protein INR49_027185 [Caranx melampygus]|nr:hypothetical protein INR49_027185 [Caranx melampygus]
MMIFWIPYLLFGSISCSPVLKAHGPLAAPVAASEPVEVPLPYHLGTNMAAGSDRRPHAAPVAASEPVEVPLPYHLGSWKRWVSANRGNIPAPPSAHPGSYSGTYMAAGSDRRPHAAPVAASEPVEVPLPYHLGTNKAGGNEFNSGYASYGLRPTETLSMVGMGFMQPLMLVGMRVMLQVAAMMAQLVDMQGAALMALVQATSEEGQCLLKLATPQESLLPLSCQYTNSSGKHQWKVALLQLQPKVASRDLPGNQHRCCESPLKEAHKALEDIELVEDCCSSRRIFWIQCLLIGSISCSPVLKAHGPHAAPVAAPVAASEPVEVPLPYHLGTNMAAGSDRRPHAAPVAATEPVEVPLPYHLGTNMAAGSDRRPHAAPVAASEPVEVPLPYHLGSWKRWVSANRGNIPAPASADPGSYSGTYMAAGSDRRPHAAPVAASEPVEVPLPYHLGTNKAGGNEFNSGYASYGVEAYRDPEHGGYGVYATSHASGYEGNAPSGGYDGSAGGYAGSSSYGYVSHQDGTSSGSDGNTGPEAPEPVLSDVSDLEPVYSFSSRSSYQRGRAVFAQTRYTPGEPAPPVMPVYKLVRKTPMESGPAAAPAKVDSLCDGDMTAVIISALNTLTKPLGDASDTQSSHQEALLAGLRTNRALLLQQLQSESSLQEVARLREEVAAEAEWFTSDTEDVTWGFVQECLLLLLTLAKNLSHELELFKRTCGPAETRRHTPEMAPPLPPDVFSVIQQKTLRAALQFVVSLGLCPYLAPGVGVPLGCRSAFGAMVEKLVRGGQVSGGEMGRRLFITTSVLLKLAELSSLATLVFTQHLGDVMAALCQLGHQPHQTERKGTEEERDLSTEEYQTCKGALRGLLGRVYQPLVIKELLILQGAPRQAAVGSVSGSSGRAAQGSAPAWLRRLCGQLLSERLMQPNGVQAVVRAILEGGTGGEADWRKCDGVARILVACPKQSASADSYYRQVCPQILDLLHFKDKLTAQQFQRVATRVALSMVQEKPGFAHQYLLVPLLAPLQRCTTASNEGHSHAAVEEWELTRCVEDVYKVWVVGNSPSAALLKALEEVLPVIFSLFCFTKKNVSHLRAHCQGILLWYLSHTETPAALSALRQLSGLQGQKDKAADFIFTPGSDGGARFSPRESLSDEDDALYEKLSGEQWKLDQCTIMSMFLLQELTSWAAGADKVQDDQEELNVSTMTLLEVEQQVLGRAARQSQRLALLQALAVMVESLQHTVLLRKTTQVVDFIVTLLQRACVGLDQATDPSAETPVESQTLSMAMGLVATLLSGPQLNAEDYSSMWRLLSPLETLSQRHCDMVVQELASNLRTVIATHGAYRPGNLTAAQAGRHPERTERSNSESSRKKQRVKTEADDSQARPQSSPPDSKTPSKIHSRQPVSSGGSAAGTTPQGEGTTSGTSVSGSSTESFSDWLLQACDPDVPTRACALRVLTQMVQNQNPEAIQAQEKVLTLFLENLEHEDSFIYLSAIQGLAALADSYPERILERLLKDFQHGPSLPTSNKEHSLETRLKLGEVLMRASRAMGELAPHLGCPLVGVFLQATRDPDQTVRASSLSNLGELCQRLDYALGPLAELLSYFSDKDREAGRGAQMRGTEQRLEHNAEVTEERSWPGVVEEEVAERQTDAGVREFIYPLKVLGDVLLDLYRALKWVVRSDPDDVAVLHAQLALEELDDVMRRFIFPEQKLEKKIVVLP